MSLRTVFENSRGRAEVIVPEVQHKNIAVTVEVDHRGVSVECHSRATAFTLVSMLLGDDAVVIETNDPGAQVP